ncbi:MAG: ABC transporter ATP-binding protein, partial [Chloroflexi bacterium]|nr:ABC transporter ATP-binding protein [Chloroflexota bacterium]
MIHSHHGVPTSGDEAIAKVYDHRIAMRLLGYLGPFKWRIALSVLFLLTASAASLAGPYLIKLAIDSGIGQKDLLTLDAVIAIFVGAQLANWGASYGQTYLMSWVGQNIIFRLRQQLFDHLQRLSFSFYDHTGVGRLMSRVQNDVSSLQDLLTSGIISVIGDVATLVGIVVVMLSMNLSLSLLTFTVLPLMILVAALWQARARRTYRSVRQTIADVNGALQEDLSGIRVVQSFGREERNLADFKEVNRRNLQANVNAAVLSGVFYPTSDLMAAVATGLVIWYGGSQVLHLQLTAGELVAFILYVGRFFDPIRDISQRYDTLQSAMAAGERIFELTDLEPDIVDPPDAVELPMLRGDVQFDHVSFGYDATTVLRDVTLEAKAGQAIAFVGETGAGKSSLINLIGRFYDIRKGRITIDGTDLHRIS